MRSSTTTRSRGNRHRPTSVATVAALPLVAILFATAAPAVADDPATTDARTGPGGVSTAVVPDATPAVTTPPPATTPTRSSTPTTTAGTTTTTTIVSAPRRPVVVPAHVAPILATIRYVESRGIYTLPPNRGQASGAYQFIPSTWDGYGGYDHAYLAPPDVQDERAALDVLRFLDDWDGDISMIPVMWYFPRAALDPSLMDIVPKPENGNVLTIREYQFRWLSVYAFLTGRPIEALIPDWGRTERDGMPPELPDSDDGEIVISFPVLGPMRPLMPGCDDAAATDGAGGGPTRTEAAAAGLCTDRAPAIVFGIKLQPVVAAVDGIVTSVDDEPGSGRPISVTITDPAGRSYVYEGFNDDTPGTNDGRAPEHLRLTAASRIGGVVRAGQVIGFMGDTSPLPVGIRADVPTDPSVTIDPGSVAPHIRLSIVDLDGRPVDAFGPTMDAIFRQSCTVEIGPWSTPPRDTETEPLVIETTDDDPRIDSEWIITSRGQVTAAGWAAQVNPNEGCPYTPADAFGPGGEGFVGWPPHWDADVDLPTHVWITLALREEEFRPDGPLRRG